MNKIIDFETSNKNGALYEPMMIICPEKFEVPLFILSVYLSVSLPMELFTLMVSADTSMWVVPRTLSIALLSS